MFGRLLPLALAICAACAIPPAPIPHTEFLVATQDSAFWVQTDAQGIHVRGVPMTLARYDGRFHEVYVANLNKSYPDAVFTGEHLFVRDLMTNDSAMVYEDTIVARSAAHYAKANPASVPLDTSADLPDDPALSVTGETDILDIRGPYVLFEHRSSIQHGDDEQDDTTRTAIDLRSGRTIIAEVHAKDPIAPDSTVVRTLPTTWHRAGYDLVARGDSRQDTISFLLRDPLQRTWHVMTVEGHPRLYWLDAPSIDLPTRRALLHAFDGAAIYDGTIKYVRYVPHRGTSLVHDASFHHGL
jgi:hypothetical protein